MIGKQILAFGKSEKSEFINIGIFAASSGGRKGRRHIKRFTPDHVWSCLQKNGVWLHFRHKVFGNGSLYFPKVRNLDEGGYRCEGLSSQRDIPAQSFTSELIISCKYEEDILTHLCLKASHLGKHCRFTFMIRCHRMSDQDLHCWNIGIQIKHK